MKSIEWISSSGEAGVGIRFIDQTKLPLEEIYITADDEGVIVDAIRTLKIRGAPLIGIAAAYGLALTAVKSVGCDRDTLLARLQHTLSMLSSTRPTASNLFWALRRMEIIFNTSLADPPDVLTEKLVDEALAIHREDAEMCERIGVFGAQLIPVGATILTHCNTGALATGGEGTALSAIAQAAKQGKVAQVFVDETRPLLQGARLTMWELIKKRIPAVLITDSSAAALMRQGKIDVVIVGADRIAANGGVANKIGTYSLAIAAEKHQIPFYVAAPTSTMDFSTATERDIPIEDRDSREITEVFGKPIAPAGSRAYAAAFDVTPPELVSAIVTERGVHRPPFSESLSEIKRALEKEYIGTS